MMRLDVLSAFTGYAGGLAETRLKSAVPMQSTLGQIIQSSFSNNRINDDNNNDNNDASNDNNDDSDDSNDNNDDSNDNNDDSNDNNNNNNNDNNNDINGKNINEAIQPENLLFDDKKSKKTFNDESIFNEIVNKGINNSFAEKRDEKTSLIIKYSDQLFSILLYCTNSCHGQYLRLLGVELSGFLLQLLSKQLPEYQFTNKQNKSNDNNIVRIKSYLVRKKEMEVININNKNNKININDIQYNKYKSICFNANQGIQIIINGLNDCCEIVRYAVLKSLQYCVQLILEDDVSISVEEKVYLLIYMVVSFCLFLFIFLFFILFLDSFISLFISFFHLFIYLSIYLSIYIFVYSLHHYLEWK